MLASYCISSCPLQEKIHRRFSKQSVRRLYLSVPDSGYRSSYLSLFPSHVFSRLYQTSASLLARLHNDFPIPGLPDHRLRVCNPRLFLLSIGKATEAGRAAIPTKLELLLHADKMQQIIPLLKLAVEKIQLLPPKQQAPVRAIVPVSKFGAIT